MSEKTREHLEAVRLAIADAKEIGEREAKIWKLNMSVDYRVAARRLAEVAAIIEAKLEQKP